MEFKKVILCNSMLCIGFCVDIVNIIVCYIWNMRGYIIVCYIWDVWGYFIIVCYIWDDERLFYIIVCYVWDNEWLY